MGTEAPSLLKSKQDWKLSQLVVLLSIGKGLASSLSLSKEKEVSWRLRVSSLAVGVEISGSVSLLLLCCR